MNIQLSEHFTYKKLMAFTLPSIGMMIFTSIYGIVDGIFVSNFVGKTSFAAVNLIMPFLMIFSTIGFMVGTGGSALISMKMGEGKRDKANEIFSMLVVGSGIVGAILGILGIVFLRPISIALGATEAMLHDCVVYGRIMLAVLPCFILQCEFQNFCVTAEKPKMGLGITVAAGMTNIVLDALFVAAFQWGIIGAAVASATSQFVGAVIPMIYFARKNKSALKLCKFVYDGNALLRTCTNGASELVSNLSMSVVNMLYNLQLMRFAGEDGVAAFGVIMYANFIFIGVFFGYSAGVAPVVGYHYGAGNHKEMQSLLKKSLVIMTGFSLILTVAAEFLAGTLSGIFVGYDLQLLELTTRAFMIYSISFVFMGYNIFGSAFFTALNNGAVSALISFLRAFVFQILFILLLPMIWGLDGIWFAVTAAELLSLGVTIACFTKNKNRYKY